MHEESKLNSLTHHHLFLYPKTPFRSHSSEHLWQLLKVKRFAMRMWSFVFESEDILDEEEALEESCDHLRGSQM